MILRTVALIIIIIFVVLALPNATPQQPEPPAAVPVATSTEELSQVYFNNGAGYSIQVPRNYTIDEFYHYQGLGPGKNISGVQFVVATGTVHGTNLSSDTYVSVEELTHVNACTADLFLNAPAMRTVTEGDMTYSVGSVVGAAAGNRYEETVYALPQTDPCLAVRYRIHYGTIGNYPPHTVREFDKTALLAEFDQIRRSLTIVQ